jgi:hypothetical protein
VAPQALFLLNHPFVIEQARHAAGRLARDTAAADDDARFAHACHLILGRPPRAGEVALARGFLAGVPAGEPAAAAWAQLVQALFASADFRYLE